MATAGKSPSQVLELPEGASLQAIEAAYAQGLQLLDAQSMAAYGMFDAQSAGRLRGELTAAYEALKAAAASHNEPAAALTSPPPAAEPSRPSDAPVQEAAPQNVAVGVAPSVSAAPPRAVQAPPAAAAPQLLPEPGPEPELQETQQAQSPPLRAVPTMSLGQDALRVRLCAPRADPLAEPLTGAVLKQLRESLGANVDDVCEVTKINRRYIVALEEEDYSLLPATVYVRGFVGEYARVLGLQTQATAPYVEAYVRWCSAHS